MWDPGWRLISPMPEPLTAKPHVTVLMGGESVEREVSLDSGKGVVAALEERGYPVTALDARGDWAPRLWENRPEVVFNALHGKGGEDGAVQGLLDTLRIPYTHSGQRASALAMHKPTTCILCEAAGLLCAPRKILRWEELAEKEPMARPFVIKPLDEGSSVGVKIIREGDELPAPPPGGESRDVMLETYVPGREIQVAVLEGRALGAIEIRPKQGFYDYDAKYRAGLAEHLMPAPLEPDAYQEVCELAETAHRALGCRGVTRSDFRYHTEEKRFYFLEINTQPGMTKLSLVPEIAAYGGMGYGELVEKLLHAARWGD